MKKNIDKLLVLITSTFFIILAIILFWVDISCPKKINVKDGLVFGDINSSINLVVFEDFKCRSCKKFSKIFLPNIKDKYIDTNKINFVIIPLAFIEGSRSVANAVYAIYKINKDQFFEFIKIISTKDLKIETKKDLINIVKKLQGINLEIFKEFLNKEVFDEYLQNNLVYAKKVMKTVQVPTIYLNGNTIKINQLNEKLEELISFKEKNHEIISK